MSNKELFRLRKVRGAQCASVSRLTSQVEEILRKLADQHTSRLKQLNESLNSKLDVISPLDDKILDLTPEDELEREVQLADETRLRTNTATAEEFPFRKHDSSRESTTKHHVCHVKLPKLFIKKFGGDLTRQHSGMHLMLLYIVIPTYQILKGLIIRTIC